ncbi:hypothetical protein LOAG_11470 [Loa loa]|uniref:Uncharacterized protein n=1 Tax=Loa loa TaxID=7209 RepID=A0A1S0TN24_LOALO|nr:hypothetical protein LOAG_11470 [Loa loa]EFO17033.1 hypothetical protein LOAG_11470 [Loa loa]
MILSKKIDMRDNLIAHEQINGKTRTAAFLILPDMTEPSSRDFYAMNDENFAEILRHFCGYKHFINCRIVTAGADVDVDEVNGRLWQGKLTECYRRTGTRKELDRMNEM